MNYKDKLIKIWQLSGEQTFFTDWLIEESERNHKKSVQMACDLGGALGLIAELQVRLKEQSGGGLGQRELLIGYETNRWGGMNDTNRASINDAVDNYLFSIIP